MDDNKKTIKKAPVLKKKNDKVFDLNPNFAKFDTETGEKIAEDSEQLTLARMEAMGEAKKTKRSPSNAEETAKDAATGGSLAFLTASSAISKDSNKIKALTSMRKRGLVGVAGAAAAGALSQRKQKSEYNRQQAAREMVAGKETGRSSSYKKYLESKYRLGDK